MAHDWIVFFIFALWFVGNESKWILNFITSDITYWVNFLSSFNIWDELKFLPLSRHVFFLCKSVFFFYSWSVNMSFYYTNTCMHAIGMHSIFLWKILNWMAVISKSSDMWILFSKQHAIVFRKYFISTPNTLSLLQIHIFLLHRKIYIDSLESFILSAIF